MYYHPFMFNNGHREHALSAWQVLVDTWLDGMERHRGVQMDAIKDFYATQMDNARTLSETTDAAEFAARLFVCAAPAPLKVVETSARFGEIAADTQRQIVELLGSHAQEFNALAADFGANGDEPPRKTGKGTLSTRRRQMAA